MDTEPTTHGIRGHRILTEQEHDEQRRMAEQWVSQHPLTAQAVARAFDVPIELLTRYPDPAVVPGEATTG